MTEFTLYSYQCCPIRPDMTPKINQELFIEQLQMADRKALENMEIHQELIDRILTTDLQRHFESQRPSSKTKGKNDRCMAFFHNNKQYYFKMLLPLYGEKTGYYMLRIANPKQQLREVDFKRILQPDEPSALVIIDNRKDQQRILIERTRAWKETDTVKNILQACIGGVLRHHYNVGMRIEPVWQKNTFENIVRLYGNRIKEVDFYVGYPNMGRTGDKFLTPLKESLRNTYASAYVRYTVPKDSDLGIKKTRKRKDQSGNEKRMSLCLEADNLDPVMEEIADHCRTTGLPMKIGLTEGHSLSLQRVPEAQLKRMSAEKRKLYEGVNEVYSTYTVTMGDNISQFDGQDDLFGGVNDTVKEKLNELRNENA